MAGKDKNRWLWTLWGAFTVLLLGLSAATMAYGGTLRHLFLIGRTTDAHHQIEMACSACHTSWFGGREAIEEACLSCHQEDLKNSKDNHPASKFNDPRNADRLAKLDATKCLTCHVEHHPEVTGPMAVTVPMDYCVACHADIGEDRKTHKNLAFDTCAGAGCHNYHDNLALYEDFLEKHLNEPAIKRVATVALIDWHAMDAGMKRPQPATVPDAPVSVTANAHIMSDWLGSACRCGGQLLRLPPARRGEGRQRGELDRKARHGAMRDLPCRRGQGIHPGQARHASRRWHVDVEKGSVRPVQRHEAGTDEA